MVSPQKFLEEKNKKKTPPRILLFDITESFSKSLHGEFKSQAKEIKRQVNNHIDKFVKTPDFKLQVAGVVDGVYFHVRYYRSVGDVPVLDGLETITENDYLDYVLHGLSMR